MLTLKTCRKIPSDAVDAAGFEDVERALAVLVSEATRRPRRYDDLVQEVAALFPLLEGVEVDYLELSDALFDELPLEERERNSLRAAFNFVKAAVLVYPEPILILTERVGESGGDAIVEHEMVHLEQWARGDTKLVEGGQLWQGELFTDVQDINAALYAGLPEGVRRYLLLPWEKEAIIRTEGSEAYYRKLAGSSLQVVMGRIAEHEGDCELDDGDIAAVALEVIYAGRGMAEKAPSDPLHQVCHDALTSIGFQLNERESAAIWDWIVKNAEAPIRGLGRHPHNLVFFTLYDVSCSLIRSGMEERRARQGEPSEPALRSSSGC